MKVTRFLLSVLFLGAMATTASAQAVDLAWNACVPVLGVNDRAISLDNNNQMIASVLGHSQPHKAYQVYIALGSGNAGAIRDAWRFDAAGCQGSAFVAINHLPPAALSKSCPPFKGILQSLELKTYDIDAISGKARAACAVTYPEGQTVTVNPAQRYFLAGFQFDHTFSIIGATTPGVDCGGLEVAVCAHLTITSWLTLDGIEIPWQFGNEYLTSNDPSNSSGCPGATPAEATTWGSIKHQYKR